MRLWQVEQEAFKAMEEAKTLADFVRIGFNSVRVIIDSDNIIYLTDMVGDHKVGGQGIELDGRIPAELDQLDTDDLGLHIIYVKVKPEDLAKEY